MGGGNNLGIRNSSGGVILVLNPDTRPAPSAIKELYSYLKSNPQFALVGPKLLNPDGSLQNSCARFPNFWLPILRRTFLGDRFRMVRDHLMMEDFDYKSSCPVDWLMGSCLMFKRQVSTPSGNKQFLFDDRYFMYFEDIDLCRQVWASGFKVSFVSTAEVVHDHSRGSAKHPWYFAPFCDRLTRTHIISWLKYFLKWGFKIINY
jgi:GT2 family glycosyltransferase